MSTLCSTMARSASRRGVGLGLALNEENCAKYPFQPVDLRHYKGTLTNVRPAGASSYYFDGLPAVD